MVLCRRFEGGRGGRLGPHRASPLGSEGREHVVFDPSVDGTPPGSQGSAKPRTREFAAQHLAADGAFGKHDALGDILHGQQGLAGRWRGGRSMVGGHDHLVHGPKDEPSFSDWDSCLSLLLPPDEIAQAEGGVAAIRFGGC